MSHRVACLAYLAGCLLFVPAAPLMGATFRSSETLVIEADEVIDDDLYLVGKEIHIKGTVKGDVVVFAEQIYITGTVERDLLAAGQTVVVEGKVGNTIRMAGQALKLAGTADVGGDLVGAGFSLEIEPDAQLHRDVVFAGYQLLSDGKIERNLLVGGAAIELRGELGGDAHLQVGGSGDEIPPNAFGPPPVAMPRVRPGLTLGPDARIGGTLSYKSPEESAIPDTAQVVGGVQFEKQEQQAAAPAEPTNMVWQAARRFASLLLVGLVLVGLCPTWTTGIADQVRRKPLSSLGWGSVMLALAMALFVILLIVTVTVAVLVGVLTLNELIPVVLIVGTLGMASLVGLGWLYASYVAQVVVALMIGRLIFRQDSTISLAGRLAALLLGLVLIVAASYIPIAGFLIGLAVILLGLGGLWHWWQSRPSASPALETATAIPGKPAMA